MNVAETMKAITDCAKKLIEAPKYNVGDFVGVYEYETDVRIYDIRWEGSCFVYKVYLADEETWLYDEDIAYKKDEMIEGLVEHIDCKKCGLTFTSTKCLFMDNCPHTKSKNIIEGLVEEETKPKFKVGDKIISNVFTTKDDKGWKVINIDRTGYKLISVNNPDLICDMDFKNEHYYKLVEEEMPLDKAGQITDFEYEGLAYTLPEGYIFKDENGNIINATKIVLEKKKKEYPKTYEECCKVMNYCCNPVATKTTHKEELIRKFQFLLLYRDAYWKLYGEEMGLGKPWEPDWTNQESSKYCIVYSENKIKAAERYIVNTILSFPTPEMRDAFKENFDPDIEICKEFL